MCSSSSSVGPSSSSSSSSFSGFNNDPADIDDEFEYVTGSDETESKMEGETKASQEGGWFGISSLARGIFRHGASAVQSKLSGAIGYVRETRGAKVVAFVGNGVLSAGSTVVSGATTVGSHLASGVTTGAIRLALRNAEAQDKVFIEGLNRFTGSDDLSKAVLAAFPAACHAIFAELEKAAKASHSRETGVSWAAWKKQEALLSLLNSFLACGKPRFVKLIRSTMLRASANIMAGTTVDTAPHQPPLLKILTWLSENTTPEFVQHLTAIFRADLDSAHQLKALEELFGNDQAGPGLATKIFDLAFPKGDFGLGTFNGLAASALKSSLPSVFAALVQNYIFLKSPQPVVSERESKEKAEAPDGSHYAAVRNEHTLIANELSTALYDPRPFALRMQAAANLSPVDLQSVIAAKKAQEDSEEGRLLIWSETGVTSKIKHFEKVFNISSEALIKFAKEFLLEDKNAENLMKVLHDDYAISPIFNNWLAGQLKHLASSQDPLAQAIWTNAQEHLAEILFTVAANVMEKFRLHVTPEEQRESGIFVRVLVHLAKTFKNHGEKVSFEDLSKELVNFTEGGASRRHPLHGLPISTKFRDLLWDQLKTGILPKTALPYLKQWFSQKDIKVLAEQLDGIFLKFDAKAGRNRPVSSATQACQVIGDFVSEFTPLYLGKEIESGALAKSLMEIPLVQAGLIHLNPDEKNHLQDFIKNMLVQMGTSEDPDIKNLFQEVAKHTQAMTLNLLAQTAKKIELIEQTQPRFLVKTVTRVLNITGNHFKRVVQKRNEPGLGGTLHAGVDLDRNKSPEERIKNEMDNFYVKVHAQLLRIAGVDSATDLSIPAPIFEQLKKANGPELLRKMIEKMMDRHSLNEMLLKMTEPLINAVDDLAAHDSDALNEAAEKDTPEQQELNIACGNAVKALVNMLPDVFTKVFFQIKAVQNLSAVVVGKYVMDTIGSSSLLEMINEICNRVGQEKISVADLEVSEKKKKETEKKLKLAGIKLVGQKIDELSRKFFVERWSRFQKWLDKAVVKVFGSKGLAVKKVLDAVFNVIFFKIIGTFLNVIWQATVYKLFSLMLKAYLTYRSSEVLSLVHLDVHKSAVFHLLESLVNDLEAAASSPRVIEGFAFYKLQQAMDHVKKGDPKAERSKAKARLKKPAAFRPVPSVNFGPLPDPSSLAIPTLPTPTPDEA